MLLAGTGVEQACSPQVNIGLMSQHQEAAGTEARNSKASDWNYQVTGGESMNAAARGRALKVREILTLYVYLQNKSLYTCPSSGSDWSGKMRWYICKDVSIVYIITILF